MGRKFLTAESVATPALSSGCGGFPAPIRTSIAGNEELYPLSFPLADLIRHYWGTKRWSVSTDLVVTAGADSCIVLSGALSRGILDSTFTEATDQIQLTNQGNSGPGFSASFPPAFVGSVVFSSSFSYFLDLVYGLAPALYYDGTDYFAQLSINMNIDVDDGLGNHRQVLVSTQPSVIPTSDGSVICTFDGIPSLTLLYKTAVNTGITTFNFNQLDLTPVPW